MSQHVIHVDDKVVDIQLLGVNRLPPGEGQQLAGEIRRPLGDLANLLQFDAGRVPRFERLDSKLDDPDDRPSRLLKSCAIPPASWPRLSIFWMCKYCASSCLRAVMSRAMVKMPIGVPDSSGIGELVIVSNISAGLILSIASTHLGNEIGDSS